MKRIALALTLLAMAVPAATAAPRTETAPVMVAQAHSPVLTRAPRGYTTQLLSSGEGRAVIVSSSTGSVHVFLPNGVTDLAGLKNFVVGPKGTAKANSWTADAASRWSPLPKWADTCYPYMDTSSHERVAVLVGMLDGKPVEAILRARPQDWRKFTKEVRPYVDRLKLR